MKALSFIAKFLPLILGTVVAVEATVTAPGATKAQTALTLIQVGAQIAGQAIPETHVKLVSDVINSVVGTFNENGVFTKSSSAAKTTAAQA